jgi:hypothetical protein
VTALVEGVAYILAQLRCIAAERLHWQRYVVCRRGGTLSVGWAEQVRQWQSYNALMYSAGVIWLIVWEAAAL